MQLELFPGRTVTMLSLKPPYADLILSGEKRIEFRSIYPNTPTLAFMYISKKRHQVEFALELDSPTTDPTLIAQTGGTGSEDFLAGKKRPGLKALIIQRLFPLKAPLDLTALRTFGITPPQGYIYLHKHPELLNHLLGNLQEQKLISP